MGIVSSLYIHRSPESKIFGGRDNFAPTRGQTQWGKDEVGSRINTLILQLERTECNSVWQDLAKVRHFDKKLKYFVIFWGFI